MRNPNPSVIDPNEPIPSDHVSHQRTTGPQNESKSQQTLRKLKGAFCPSSTRSSEPAGEINDDEFVLMDVAVDGIEEAEYAASNLQQQPTRALHLPFNIAIPLPTPKARSLLSSPHLDSQEVSLQQGESPSLSSSPQYSRLGSAMRRAISPPPIRPSLDNLGMLAPDSFPSSPQRSLSPLRSLSPSRIREFFTSNSQQSRQHSQRSQRSQSNPRSAQFHCNPTIVQPPPSIQPRASIQASPASRSFPSFRSINPSSN